MVDGIYNLDKIDASLIPEGEMGSILYEQNGLLYLLLDDPPQTEENVDLIQIIDIQHPENFTVIGSYELEVAERIFDFKISGNISYLLLNMANIFCHNFFIRLLNITDPTNPTFLGDSALVVVSGLVNEKFSRMSVYQNYTFVNLDELFIFDCHNLSSPQIIASYNSSIGDLHVNNGFLYLVSTSVKVFDLANPVNPILLGEINSTKFHSVDSELYGNYIIRAFYKSGIQIYNCTNPLHPTICSDYEFSSWATNEEENIQDLDIEEDRLFVGGKKFYIFDLSKPQKLKRIGQINFENQYINQTTVTETCLFITFNGTIIIYTYVESNLGHNLLIVFGIGLSIVIGVRVLVVLKRKIAEKKQSLNNP